MSYHTIASSNEHHQQQEQQRCQRLKSTLGLKKQKHQTMLQQRIKLRGRKKFDWNETESRSPPYFDRHIRFGQWYYIAYGIEHQIMLLKASQQEKYV